ncbi:Transmembrane protein [Hirschfeldia incana]|nr:Transmembrane protein [Hirschfeldia incana]KAJ0261142.1 Transmembrane protein [Hirschfeldia incana]
MDLEDWELLPKDPYKGLDHEEYHDAAMMITRDTEKSLDMDYFICPTQDSVGKTEFHRRVVPTQLLQVPVTWEPVSTVEDTDIKKNQDSVLSPRITFKTAKENKLVDMKIDLAEKFTSALPQKDEKHSVSGGEYHDEMRKEVEEVGDLRSKKEVEWEEDENISGEKLNMWKMGLHGIGAICSFGVAAAAATFCVFFLGHNNSTHGCRNKNQILRFQIYSDDNKRMNEVVKRATKLNEAISVMKGLPLARAQISFGGYYDAL